ncbi:NAD(P)H-binding protein [Nocardiopsis synnemataformans]|uniref:NAD(P)H-binding protein n=1 Tax=Nocardiopsis synnemataformans TaxID=61305 RepID=UPI003EC14E9F
MRRILYVTVFGATGGTGRHVVAQARRAGHRVQAVVRDPGRLPRRPRPARVAAGRPRRTGRLETPHHGPGKAPGADGGRRTWRTARRGWSWSSPRARSSSSY